MIGEASRLLDLFHARDGSRTVLYLTNWSLDDVPALRLHCPGPGADAVEVISFAGRDTVALPGDGDTRVLQRPARARVERCSSRPGSAGLPGAQVSGAVLGDVRRPTGSG